MDNEEAVEPQAEPIEQIMDQAMEQSEADTNVQDDNNDHDVNQTHEKTMVPLSALQKIREKKKELELELQWEKQERQRLMNSQLQAPSQPPQEDNSRYESATREDLSRSQEEMLRVVEEKLWIKANPEKYERVNEFLPKFLKQRPNLASAINLAANRYEEAYELMDKLSPKQEQQIRRASSQTPPQIKKEAPNSPGSIPKGAALDAAVDVMTMSDKEFAEWRQSKKQRR